MGGKKHITLRQRQVLEFIRRKVYRTGLSPTVREIAEYMGIRSPNGVVGHLDALEEKGYIFRLPGYSRSIVLVSQRSRNSCCNKVIGIVEDGGITAFSEVFTISGSFKKSDTFILYVKDDSLRDYDIEQGDFLVFEKMKKNTNDGEVLLQDKEGRLVLADFRKNILDKNNQLELRQEENSIFSARDIYGVFVMMFRMFSSEENKRYSDVLKKIPPAALSEILPRVLTEALPNKKGGTRMKRLRRVVVKSETEVFPETDTFVKTEVFPEAEISPKTENAPNVGMEVLSEPFSRVKARRPDVKKAPKTSLKESSEVSRKTSPEEVSKKAPKKVPKTPRKASSEASGGTPPEEVPKKAPKTSRKAASEVSRKTVSKKLSKMPSKNGSEVSREDA